MTTDVTEEELKQLLNAQDAEGWPEAPQKDSLQRFFRDVVKTDDHKELSKVGNVDKTELGHPRMTIRGALRVANYASTEGYNDVSEYLRGAASTDLSTSLSKNAALLTLFVTQRKVSKNVAPLREESKKTLFGGERKIKEGGEDDDYR